MIIDYNVWNQNIAKLSIYRVILNMKKPNLTSISASRTLHIITYIFITTFFSFEFIIMCFYTYMSMYWNLY